MIQKQIRAGVVAATASPEECVSAKSCSPQNKLTPRPSQLPQYLRWAIRNSDGHVVGHELLRVGPELAAYLAQMAQEARQ